MNLFENLQLINESNDFLSYLNGFSIKCISNDGERYLINNSSKYKKYWTKKETLDQYYLFKSKSGAINSLTKLLNAMPEYINNEYYLIIFKNKTVKEIKLHINITGTSMWDKKVVITESLNEVTDKSKTYNICKQVRDELVNKYGEDFLYGKCIEASDKIVELLNKEGIDAKTVEGWCVYDDDSGCSDRPYDEHTWVELEDGTYIDVTATQFQSFIEDDIPDIIIGNIPYYMSYNEPQYNY